MKLKESTFYEELISIKAYTYSYMFLEYESLLVDLTSNK